MNLSTIQDKLNDHGFPCGPADGVFGPRTRGAVLHFQLAFNNGAWLAVDGIPGPQTQEALEKLPMLSNHFHVDELRSKGNNDCYVRRELLGAMEKLRGAIGTPLGVLSAYRDPVHNKRVGGATYSMHVEGFAFDPSASNIPFTEAVKLQIFSGIGIRNGKFAHGDLRHLSINNKTPTASLTNPVTWQY